MKLKVFFKKNKKVLNAEDIASPEHIAFSDCIKSIIGQSLLQYGFKLCCEDIKSWMTTIIYKNRKRYIKIHGSTHWHDHPFFYYIILGEGNSKDFFESDWNSISLTDFIQKKESMTEAKTYSFPYGDQVIISLTKANEDLLKYGKTFLLGDMTLFYEIRKDKTKNRQPYEIHIQNMDGNYITVDEPNSAEKKKKYS